MQSPCRQDFVAFFCIIVTVLYTLEHIFFLMKIMLSLNTQAAPGFMVNIRELQFFNHSGLVSYTSPLLQRSVHTRSLLHYCKVC